MSVRGSAVTLSLHAHERIRSDILNGVLEPGQPLRLAALSGELGVSMSVVREALTRLSEQGLVTAAPNLGFRVIPLSEDDLVDLTQVRVTLECSALGRSIARGDVAWEGQVISAHHVLDRTPLDVNGPPEAREAWIVAHAAFHDALSAGCGSPRLIGLVTALRDGAEIYRQWAGFVGDKSGRDVLLEHRRLMELATARRSDEAVAALQAHIETTTQILLAGRAAGRPGDDESVSA